MSDNNFPRKLFTKTFGCQMNFADSEEMLFHLLRRGFSSVDAEDQADAILVNTCTVRDLAEHKAMSFVGRLAEWKDEKPGRLVIVTGCAAERAKDDFRRRFPFIDLVVGAKDIDNFPEDIDRLIESRKSWVMSQDMFDSQLTTQEAQPNGVVQYVTIMRGCNYNCSYCIVPSVRGREVYLPSAAILEQIRARVAAGAKEIWLLGQTVNSYRPADVPETRPAYDFADLLRDAAAVPGVERLRFMSPHPYYLTPKLIRALAECAPVCEHMHLPAQSGSNTVLKRMRRNYTRESYLRNVQELRAAVPDISITTDLIVGFPGETDKDFDETLSLAREARFDAAYCFKYSPRKGTESAQWDDDIPEALKEERVNRLLAVTDSQGVAKAASLVGTTQEVLLEEEKAGGLLRGRTRSAWRVRVKGNGLRIGQILDVRITGSHSRELHAEPLEAGAEAVRLSKSWDKLVK